MVVEVCKTVYNNWRERFTCQSKKEESIDLDRRSVNIQSRPRKKRQKLIQVRGRYLLLCDNVIVRDFSQDNGAVGTDLIMTTSNYRETVSLQGIHY